MLDFGLIPYRQLEALDKELQQLSHIKENVDAKVQPNTSISLSILACNVFNHSKYFIFLISLLSHVVGVKEEAVPCATQYHTGATADTRE